MNFADIYFLTKGICRELSGEMPRIHEYVFLHEQAFGNLVMELSSRSLAEQRNIALLIKEVSGKISKVKDSGQKPDCKKIFCEVVYSHVNNSEMRNYFVSLLGNIFGIRSAISKGSKEATVKDYIGKELTFSQPYTSVFQ